MLVSVEIPDQIVDYLSADANLRSRQLIEAFLLKRYNDGEISGGRLGETLGMSFQERETFLKANSTRPTTTRAEHLKDLETLDRLLRK